MKLPDVGVKNSNSGDSNHAFVAQSYGLSAKDLLPFFSPGHFQSSHPLGCGGADACRTHGCVVDHLSTYCFNTIPLHPSLDPFFRFIT